MTDDAWHYTCGGEQVGPVSLAELREKARQGELHPRTDMVWRRGMEAWQPAGEIEGLFERRTAAVEEAPPCAPAGASPSMPPSPATLEEARPSPVRWPGARRRVFYLMLFVFPLVWYPVIGALAGYAGQSLSPQILQVIMSALLFVPTLLILYISLQRLANVGMSRWWFLGNLVPILNLWVGYRMYACPAGYAHHKKLDTAGVILAILYWLTLALSLLVLLALVAVFFGMAGSSEFQQQFNDAIQEALRKQQSAAP